MDPTPYDVFAVELSSFQLHYTESMSAESAAVLNLAEDHLDWHGSHGLADYAADKGRIYRDAQQACVYNVADPETERLVRDADVEEGARAIGFTLGIPAVGMVGVVDGLLVDRAFIAERQSSAAELCTIDDLPSPAPHVVANALAAAALARAHGVPQARCATACARFAPDGHRIADRRQRRRRHVRRRLQGDQPARRRRRRCWPTTRGVGRRRPGQGRHVRRAGRAPPATGCGAPCCSAATATSSRAALARHAPDVPVIAVDAGETGTGHAAMDASVVAARTSPTRATPSCWPRAAPPWTCSRTTPTGAMPSPRRCED